MNDAKTVNYPYSDEVYEYVKDIPNNGIAYNVATMYNKYESKAANSTLLIKGVDNTLSLTDAIEVIDNITITDTHTATIKLSGGDIIPGEASYAFSHGSAYTHGEVKKFSISNTISITPKTENLTATPYYYKVQMSGDRYRKVDGTASKMNIQPESFSADITYAEGWFISLPNGTKAISGVDY